MPYPAFACLSSWTELLCSVSRLKLGSGSCDVQCSHIMAMSVQRLFPGTQVTIGPWIDRGFYYDFDTPQPISTDDLKGIKKEMQKIIKQKLPFIREEVNDCSPNEC